MLNRKLISDFADIIGNLEIAIHLDSYKSVRNDYENILSELLKWIDYYYKNRNFDIVTHEQSIEIHTLLDTIKWNILPDKEIGMESVLTDNILIRYEVIIKTINEERGLNNANR